MKRRDFLKAGGAGLAVLGLARPGGAELQPRRPNIVFVFADQLRSQSVGCYGAAAPATPHIDRLAAEGVRFTNAISTYPICSPYRAMLMTGLYPMRNGMVANDLPLRPGVPSFAQALRAAGYHTGYIGKWHIDGHGREACIPPERRLGFQHWQVLECTHAYNKSKYYEGDSQQPKFWEGYDAVAQTRAAQEYIQARSGQAPFALFLSWGPPHDPYTAPGKYMKRYAPEKIALRENLSEHAVADEMFAHQRNRLPEKYAPLRKRMHDWVNSDASLRRALAGYYAATACLDDLVGDLRRTLEERGILEETIFVFTSDHGDQLGSHRIFGKDVPFEESISIPFIVRYPAKIRPKTVTDALLAPIDIMPTVLGLAGAPCPKVDGADLSAAATGHEGSKRDALLLMQMSPICNAWLANAMDAWRGVRTRQYTYARHDDGAPWLLYDNHADPMQMHNLVADPAYAGLRKSLDLRLAELLKEAGDPGNQRAVHDYALGVQPGYGMMKEYRAVNPGK
jgi:arylsulfatase A-like enzyme